VEKIIRSLFQVGSVPDSEDVLMNWKKYQDYELEPQSEADKQVLDYLRTFYEQMAAPPELDIMREFFEKQDNIEAVSRIEEVSKVQWHISTNFLSLVRQEQDQQHTKKLAILCRDASAIAEHGRTQQSPGGKKVTLRGVSDAVDFLYENLHDFARVEGGEKLEAVVTDDAEEFLDEYDRTEKVDKFANRNLFGLEPVDSVCKGHRRGEFWVHTAFTGELKSTLALNYAYNNVMVYDKNIFYAILEMPYIQLRRQLYVIHSSHGKFITEWHKDDGYVGLDYRKVRDGELSAKDKQRLRIVATDFKESARGKLYVWRPKKDEEGTIAGIRRKAEMFDNKYGCDGLIIDHLGLVTPKRHSQDNVATQNAVVRDARLMALNFSRGKGVPLLGLWQMNRQGKMRADKNNGYYDISAIAYANECLFSGTLVRTSSGLVPVEDVEPGKHRVWSLSGWKDVIEKFDQGIQECFEVKTDRGTSVTVTGGHRFRSLVEGSLSWSKVKDLKPGDFLLSDFGSYEFPKSSQGLPGLDFHGLEKKKDLSGRKLRVPRRMTDDLAYLMGAFAGDGNLKPGVGVGFTLNAKELTTFSKIRSSFLTCFGQDFSAQSPPSRRSTINVLKASMPLTRWFVSVGMDRSPKVPKSILMAQKSSVCAFVRGFADTDGCINNQGIISWSAKRASENLLKEVQLLLFALGIDSTLYRRTTKLKGKKFPGNVLRVRGRRSRELFRDLIGFTEPHKSKRLSDLCDRVSASEKSGNGTLWPVVPACRKILDRAVGASASRKLSHGMKQKLISDGALRDMLKSLRFHDDPEVELLRRLVDRSIPVKIISIKKVGEKQTWDLEVSGDHEYATGGFLSHNCEKSADVITYTYLNDDLRRDGKFYLGNLKNRDNPMFDRMVGKILWTSKRIRAMETGILDLDADKIVSVSKRISGLENMYNMDIAV
jgi:intein/homing endonuclease